MRANLKTFYLKKKDSVEEAYLLHSASACRRWGVGTLEGAQHEGKGSGEGRPMNGHTHQQRREWNFAKGFAFFCKHRIYLWVTKKTGGIL